MSFEQTLPLEWASHKGRVTWHLARAAAAAVQPAYLIFMRRPYLNWKNDFSRINFVLWTIFKKYLHQSKTFWTYISKLDKNRKIQNYVLHIGFFKKLKIWFDKYKNVLILCYFQFKEIFINRQNLVKTHTFFSLQWIDFMQTGFGQQWIFCTLWHTWNWT